MTAMNRTFNIKINVYTARLILFFLQRAVVENRLVRLKSRGGGIFSLRSAARLRIASIQANTGRLSVWESSEYFCSWLLEYNVFLLPSCKLFWVQLMFSGLQYQDWTFGRYILLYKWFCKLCFKFYLFIYLFIFNFEKKCFHPNCQVSSKTKPCFRLLSCLLNKTGYFDLFAKFVVPTKTLNVTKK
jgi:hypothetical protein